jgi:hypothetical protein
VLSFVCILAAFDEMTTPFERLATPGEKSIFLVGVISQLLINLIYTLDFLLRIRIGDYQ